MNVGIEKVVDGEAVNHYVTPMAGVIDHEETVGQVVRLYADPNTSVTVDLYAGSSQPSCTVSLSGHWLGGPLRLPGEIP